MISIIRSLLPLTQRQEVLGSIYFSLALLLPALIVSPTSYFHPLWIVAFYFNGFGVIRALTDDFISAKNPALVHHAVFGPLQLLAAVLIVASGVSPEKDIVALLWFVVSLAFFYFGMRNVTGAVSVLKCESDKRKQENKEMKQQTELAAQSAQEAQERQETEDALLADLAVFLGEADQAGNGRSEG